MSKYIIDGVQMTSLADAVRSATGTSDPLSFGEIVSTVETMGTGEDIMTPFLNRTLTSFSNSDASIIPYYAFASCYSLLSINCTSVKSVSDGAFMSCWSLQTISFPKAESIGYNAFAYCSSISQLYLPECKVISTSAFYQCLSLREVNLPKCSLINTYAFGGTNMLITSLNAPKLEYIGSYVFDLNFSKLKLLSLNYIVSDFCSTPYYWGGSVIEDSTTKSAFYSLGISMNGKTMITNTWNNYLSSEANTWFDSTTSVFTFPESIGYLTGSAFVSTNGSTLFSWVKGISGDGITTIGPIALQSLSALSVLNCPNLTNLTFSSNHINFTTFIVGDLLYCDSNALRFATSTSGIPSLTRCKRFGSSAIYNKQSFVLSINLSECEVIYNDAFYNCSNITFYGELNKCLSIYQNAFAGCSKLYSIVGSQVKYLGYNAFARCESLSYVQLDVIKAISSATFSLCYGLEEVSLPNVGDLYSSAFYLCSSLKKVYAPKCSSIYYYTFYNCSQLSDLTLDWDNLKIISNAFYGCTSLISAVGDANYISAKGISDYILYANNITRTSSTFNCYMMNGQNPFGNRTCNSITMPLLKYVNSNIFYNDGYISSFTAPNCSVVYYSGFAGAGNLRMISLNNCTRLEGQTFITCSKLSDVYLPKLQYMLDNDFQNCYSLTYIDLPELISMRNSAFTGAGLTSISLPKCESIGTQAFRGCTRLSEISLPAIKYIGNSAFSGCNQLVSFYCSSLINLDPNGTFWNCGSLERVNITTQKMGFYGYSMFYNCSLLSELNITMTNGWLQAIYDNAFNQTFALTKFSAMMGSYDVYSLQTWIGQRAFQQCGMSKALFSNTQTNMQYSASIATSAFWICSKLMSLYLFANSSAKVPVWYLQNSNAFNNTPMVDDTLTGSFGSIYVQSSYLSLYQADAMWSWFTDRLVGLTDQEIENVIANW